MRFFGKMMDIFKEKSIKRINYDSYYNDGNDSYIGKKRKIPKRIARAKMKNQEKQEIEESFDYYMKKRIDSWD